MKGKKVYIPGEKFKEIEVWAKQYNETTQQMIVHLLEAQLDKIRGKAVFYPGLTWGPAKAYMIDAAVLTRDLEKLKKWLAANDEIRIITDGDQPGKIYLDNESLAGRLYEEEQKQQSPSPATA